MLWVLDMFQHIGGLWAKHVIKIIGDKTNYDDDANHAHICHSNFAFIIYINVVKNNDTRQDES